MNITVQSIRFDADDKLKEYLERKVKKLETFHDKITKAEVFLKLDQTNSQIKEKIVELKIHVPGKILFAKEHHKTFEESIDLVTDIMSRQLKKHKQKRNA